MKIQTKKVEIKKSENGNSLFAAKNFKKGDSIFVERITAFFSMTTQNHHLGGAILLTEWLLKNPHLYQMVLQSGAKTGQWKGPRPKEDLSRISQLALFYSVPRNKVEEIYGVVAAYNVTSTVITNDGFGHRTQLSPLTNMLNHLCEPNARAENVFESIDLFRERLSIISAISNISIGDQIGVSYYGEQIDFFELDVKERRSRLQADYGFICGCSRCLRESIENS